MFKKKKKRGQLDSDVQEFSRQAIQPDRRRRLDPASPGRTQCCEPHPCARTAKLSARASADAPPRQAPKTCAICASTKWKGGGKKKKKKTRRKKNTERREEGKRRRKQKEEKREKEEESRKRKRGRKDRGTRKVTMMKKVKT
jgi:hypothetical protein